jgi:hypothetical protein
VVWCGVVWCGVVWCGVVWCGVVWCGVVWWFELRVCGVVGVSAGWSVVALRSQTCAEVKHQMLGRCFTPHTRVCFPHARVRVRTYATGVQFTPTSLGEDGVLYKHTPVNNPYPNVGAIKSTAAALSEEQKTQIRKMRYLAFIQ